MSTRLGRVTDLNAIDQRVFPPSARRGRDCGQLKLGEIRATELAERFNTPLYIIDERAARDRAREMREALQREFVQQTKSLERMLARLSQLGGAANA